MTSSQTQLSASEVDEERSILDCPPIESAMKGLPMLRPTALLLIFLVLSGCKLAVIVVEGGEVQSDAFDTCAAGNICIRNVVDTTYAETLTAAPDPGWVFVKWNAGGNFLCANEISESCNLTTEGASGVPALEEIIFSNRTFYVMPVFVEADLPNTLVVDGKIWKQPAEFTSLSWNEINSVCPIVSNGDCEGTLNGIDVSDWRWASASDLASMLSTYGPSVPRGNDHVEELDSEWAPAFFAAGWEPTYDVDFNRFTSGWLRDEGFDSTQGTNGGIEQGFGETEDYAWAGNSDPKTESLDVRGAWFYYSP